MILSEDIVEKIRKAAFPDNTSGLVKKRIAAVYGPIMGPVKAADKDAVIDEIIEWEKVWAGNGNSDLSRYENISNETRLMGYSQIASYFAHKKLASPDDVFLLPLYASKAFSLFIIETREYFSQKGHALLVLVSDTGTDFLYAAGRTKCMSMRLWEEIR